jgi:fructosamine-3-kinase
MSFGKAPNPLAVAGARLLNGTLRQTKELGGGDLSKILCITLTDGREAIVKNSPAPRIEAAMLQAIAASGAPAPKVHGTSDDVLVLEVLPNTGGLNRAWASLGKALATLHNAKGERYGWPEDFAFGAVSISNVWSENWPSFWAERRLLPHSAFIPPKLARRIEKLAEDLSNRLPAHPTPVLLHGDLWSGNVLASGKNVTGLVDPACYYGHGEVDIAMLTLFGSPSSAFFDAYGVLEDGWKTRLRIYQLWPALVHVRLFGRGYESMVTRLLSAF